jgi:vacuolar-type H+-ATPase subunit F/Vma7
MVTREVEIVCTSAVSQGFAAAGIDVVVTTPGLAGTRCLESVLTQPSTGLVFVEEPLFACIGEETRRALRRRPVPIVVPFPGPTEVRGSAEDYIVELLRQAIGYRVRLR